MPERDDTLPRKSLLGTTILTQCGEQSGMVYTDPEVRIHERHTEREEEDEDGSSGDDPDHSIM